MEYVKKTSHGTAKPCDLPGRGPRPVAFGVGIRSQRPDTNQIINRRREWRTAEATESFKGKGSRKSASRERIKGSPIQLEGNAGELGIKKITRLHRNGRTECVLIFKGYEGQKSASVRGEKPICAEPILCREDIQHRVNRN